MRTPAILWLLTLAALSGCSYSAVELKASDLSEAGANATLLALPIAANTRVMIDRYDPKIGGVPRSCIGPFNTGFQSAVFETATTTLKYARIPAGTYAVQATDLPISPDSYVPAQVFSISKGERLVLPPLHGSRNEGSANANALAGVTNAAAYYGFAPATISETVPMLLSLACFGPP